jgi:hypothetical protein
MKPLHVMIAVAVTAALAGLVAAFRGSTSSAVLSSPESGTLPAFPRLLAREKLEPGFIRKLLKVIRETGANGDRLASLIDEESGWNPQARNGIGAAGFLQWVPKYAVGSTGHTSDEIAGETGLQELDDVKTAILHAPGYKTDPAMQGWGSHINAPDATVIATDPEQAYTLNKVYDKAGKGSITVGDVRAAVYGRLSSVAGKRVGDGGVLV